MKEQLLKAFEEKQNNTNNIDLKKSIQDKIDIIKGNKKVSK